MQQSRVESCPGNFESGSTRRRLSALYDDYHENAIRRGDYTGQLSNAFALGAFNEKALVVC